MAGRGREERANHFFAASACPTLQREREGGQREGGREERANRKSQTVQSQLPSQCSVFLRGAIIGSSERQTKHLAVSDPDDIQLELPDDDPHMPALRDMHRLVAQNPRVQSKFFLFMLSTHVRHVLGIDDCWWGRHKVAKPAVPGKEDNACASLRPCLLPFPVACMGPGESQERGFEHAHIKVHGLSVVDARCSGQCLLRFYWRSCCLNRTEGRSAVVSLASNRLATPEMSAIFADVRRRPALLSSVLGLART